MMPVAVQPVATEPESNTVADSEATQGRCSKNFDSKDADVTYESCDGVQFRIHIIYLETHSGVLSPPPKALLEDVVNLPEESGTLEHLFHFIYPRPQTNLDAPLELEELWKLAEAAEKYRIYPAMYACHIRMKYMLPNCAPYVLAHALKHDYDKLADLAARSALDTKPQNMIDILPSSFHKIWFTYYDSWLEIQRRLVSSCGGASNLVVPLIASLSGLTNLESTLSGISCQGWLDPFHEEIEKNRNITRLLAENDDGLNQPSVDGPEPEGINHLAQNGISICMRRDVLIASAPKLTFLQNLGEGHVEIASTPSTFNLLLKFLRPDSIPDIGELPFEELEDLSYKAENFSVYQAMSVCHFFMKKTVSSSSPHNWAVFQYAVRHGYKDIMDVVAPHALDQSYDDQIEHLSTSLVASCSKFRQQWQNILNQISEKILTMAASVQGPRSGYRYGTGICPTCSQVFTDTHVYPTILKFYQPHNISSVQLLLESGASSRCEHAKKIFQSSLDTFKDLIKAVPPFSTYLE